MSKIKGDYDLEGFNEEFEDLPYVAPPPNEYAIRLSELKFGTRSYEKEMLEYDKALSMKSQEVGYKKAKSIITPWRETVNDKLAMIPINEDPEVFKKGESYKTPPPWDADVFQDILLGDINILGKTILCSSIKKPDLSTLMIEIDRKFKREMIPWMENYWKVNQCEMSDYYLNRIEQYKSMFRNRSSIIIARFLVGLYYIIPDYWIERGTELTQVLDSIHVPDNYSKTGKKFVLKGGSKDKDDNLKIRVDGVSSSSGKFAGIKFKKRNE